MLHKLSWRLLQFKGERILFQGCQCSNFGPRWQSMTTVNDHSWTELVTFDTYSAVLRSVSRHFNPYSHLPRVTSVAKMIVEWGKFPNEAVHFGPSDSKTSARVMDHLQRVSLSGKTRVFMFVFLFLSLDFLVFFLHTGEVVGKCFHGSSGVALSLIPCSESPHHPEYLMAGSMADLRQIVTPPMVVIRLSMFAFHPSYLHLLISFLPLPFWS